MRSRNKFISFLVLFFLVFGFASAQGPVFRVRLFDTDYSHYLQLMWNEASAAIYTLNFLVNGGSRSFMLYGNLTVESASLINQDLTTDAALVQFAKLGIGTATIPHGGVGLAKFAIDGTASSSAGPHIQTTVDTDDYPVLQFLSYAHDNMNISFDSYYDGAWKSSDAGSSFQITKQSDVLDIKYDDAAAGEAITWNSGIILNTSGGVGIGTATIPHGGVGVAKFAIEGTYASSAGPHVQFTTAEDDYPLLQILNHFHDEVYINFDAYYDYTSWKSSDAGSNFSIQKIDDTLRLQYDSGIAQGDVIIWNDGIVLSTAGIVSMPAVYAHDMTADTYRNLLINDSGELGYDSSPAPRPSEMWSYILSLEARIEQLESLLLREKSK